MLALLPERQVARQSIKVTLGKHFGEGRYDASANPSGPATLATAVTDVGTAVTDAATMVAAQTPAAAAMAVLVADGASPTQAHVNTMNTAYGTLATAVAAMNTDVGTLNTDITAANVAFGGNVQIIFDSAVITTITQLKRAFDAALQAAAGGGILTP